MKKTAPALPPGAKSKSKARQHAKSNRREKQNKKEKPKTSSSSRKTDYPEPGFDPELRKERLSGPRVMSDEEDDWDDWSFWEESTAYLGLNIPIYYETMEAIRLHNIRRLDNNLGTGGRLRNEVVSKPESPEESPTATSDSGNTET